MLRAQAIRQQLQDALATLRGRAACCASTETQLSLKSDQTDQAQKAINLRKCLAKSCWQQAARLQQETRQYVTAVGHSPQTMFDNPTGV